MAKSKKVSLNAIVSVITSAPFVVLSGATVRNEDGSFAVQVKVPRRGFQTHHVPVEQVVSALTGEQGYVARRVASATVDSVEVADYEVVDGLVI